MEPWDIDYAKPLVEHQWKPVTLLPLDSGLPRKTPRTHQDRACILGGGMLGDLDATRECSIEARLDEPTGEDGGPVMPEPISEHARESQDATCRRFHHLGRRALSEPG